MSYYDRFYSGYLVKTDKETDKAVHGQFWHVAEGLAPGAPVLSWSEHAEGWVPKKATKGERYGSLMIHSWFTDAMRGKIVLWHVQHPEDANAFHERHSNQCEYCPAQECPHNGKPVRDYERTEAELLDKHRNQAGREDPELGDIW